MLTELGYCSLHLHYNSGRSIAGNAADLAEMLERLVKKWPGQIDSIVLIGHSMGGLVARGACALAEQTGQGWLSRTHKLVCLGSPHQGAPLERAGHGLEQLLAALPLVAPFARLARLRSAGITDLRHGSLQSATDGPTVLQPPAGLHLYLLAASRSLQPAVASRRRPRSDGLVPVASALGEHRQRARSLAVPASRKALLYGMHHLQILYHPTVSEQVRGWLLEPSGLGVALSDSDR
nr:alpha/beta fold hydrolase [Pseudomarimonas arenosa]